MKKMLALFLAVLMALSLTAPAFAAATTIPEEVQLLIDLGIIDSAEGLVDAVPYGEPEHGNFVIEAPYESDADLWIAANPELVADFYAGGWRAVAVAFYGDYIFGEMVSWWGSEEAAIEEFLYSWAWEMAWIDNYFADAAALKVENPALYAEYAAHADTYVYENLWFASKEECMDYYYGITDEQFIDIMVGRQIEDAQYKQRQIDMIEEYRTAHPGELEAIDWDAYFRQEYYYYSSVKEFMDSYGMLTLEEFYTHMQSEYVYNATWLENLAIERAETVRQKRLALGMSKEGHALVVNGEAVNFSQPMTTRHGSLYAPAAELAAALGFTGSYADLLVDGQLPVRLTAERAGYSVFWDEIMDAAVLIDMEKIAATLDEQFTIFNRTIARAAELRGKDGSGTVDMNLTMFDSLDGDKTYKASLKYTFGWKEETTYWLKGSLTSPNFADAAKLLRDIYMMEAYYYSEAEIAQYEKLFTTLGALKSIEFAMEYNMETGYVTLSLPLMATIAKLMGETMEPSHSFFAGKVDITDMDTAGGLIAQMALTMAESAYSPYYDYEFEYNNSPVYYWEKMTTGLPTGMDYLADSAFTRKGSEDVMELTVADLAAIAADEDEFYTSYYTNMLHELLPKFNLLIAINDRGESRLSFEMRVDLAGLTGMNLPISMGAEMTAESKDSGNTQESTSTVHVKNVFKLELKSKVVYK